MGSLVSCALVRLMCGRARVRSSSPVCTPGTPSFALAGSHKDAAAALLDGSPLGAIFPTAKRTTFHDVKVQKPGAAPYLRAAELSKHPPSECFAYEDSPSGLQSAAAAGCKYRLGIMTSYQEPALMAAGATHVFADTVSAIRWAIGVAVCDTSGE
jgi:beta-phosphoglucomutase-like phosphatase (HAD superfamily)